MPGEVIAFTIAIDATEALPPRSIVAITALPDGAAFSGGRPYGVSGWSLRPDEIGDLRLRLPARSGTSDMRLELVTGDGTVLSQSETRLSIAPSPAEAETVGAIESDSSEPQAPAEWMETNIPEGLAVFALPVQQRRRMRTSNLLERLNRELKRRTRVATLFPNEASLLRLVSAVLVEVSEEWETGKIYLRMDQA